jgi:hypothetical protein
MRRGDGSKVEKQIKKKKAKAWEKLLKDKETQSNKQRGKMKWLSSITRTTWQQTSGRDLGECGFWDQRPSDRVANAGRAVECERFHGDKRRQRGWPGKAKARCRERPSKCKGAPIEEEGEERHFLRKRKFSAPLLTKTQGKISQSTLLLCLMGFAMTHLAALAHLEGRNKPGAQKAWGRIDFQDPLFSHRNKTGQGPQRGIFLIGADVSHAGRGKDQQERNPGSMCGQSTRAKTYV